MFFFLRDFFFCFVNQPVLSKVDGHLNTSLCGTSLFWRIDPLTVCGKKIKSTKKKKRRRKRQHWKAMCHNKHTHKKTPTKKIWWFISLYFISYFSLDWPKAPLSCRLCCLMASRVVFCSKWGIVEHSILGKLQVLKPYKEKIKNMN